MSIILISSLQYFKIFYSYLILIIFLKPLNQARHGPFDYLIRLCLVLQLWNIISTIIHFLPSFSTQYHIYSNCFHTTLSTISKFNFFSTVRFLANSIKQKSPIFMQVASKNCIKTTEILLFLDPYVLYISNLQNFLKNAVMLNWHLWKAKSYFLNSSHLRLL